MSEKCWQAKFALWIVVCRMLLLRESEWRAEKDDLRWSRARKESKWWMQISRRKKVISTAAVWCRLYVVIIIVIHTQVQLKRVHTSVLILDSHDYFSSFFSSLAAPFRKPLNCCATRDSRERVSSTKIYSIYILWRLAGFKSVYVCVCLVLIMNPRRFENTTQLFFACQALRIFFYVF